MQGDGVAVDQHLEPAAARLWVEGDRSPRWDYTQKAVGHAVHGPPIGFLVDGTQRDWRVRGEIEHLPIGGFPVDAKVL